MTRSEIDYADIQGLVRFGFGKMRKARYYLLRIKNVPAARAWLRSAPVTNAVTTDPLPTTALQLAFTAPGLRRLGVPEEVIAQFSHEFRGGMATANRPRQLGDVGANAPERWTWGGPADELHLVAMFFAEPEHFSSWVASCTGAVWEEAFAATVLETTDLDADEPFGFKDGISQPKLDWAQQRNIDDAPFEYSNVVVLGEFLLGYRNEYGRLTNRPLLAPDAVSADLLDAVDAPDRKDLGCNGTYLVMRQLHQDVRGFWEFLRAQAGGDEADVEKLAAAMVGRQRNGDPLVPPQPRSIPGIGRDAEDVRQNQFTYDADPHGSRCPFGAHIRRANPRNTDFPVRPTSLVKKILTMLGFGPRGFRDDLMSSVRFHRLLRRGREYGEESSSAENPDRGLHFICLNANISRQFEFVQGAWMAGTKFSGLTGESDPLLGTREPIPGCPVTSDFNIQTASGLRRRITGLPQFVTVRGGAYFFLPSLRALRYIATVGEART